MRTSRCWVSCIRCFTKNRAGGFRLIDMIPCGWLIEGTAVNSGKPMKLSAQSYQLRGGLGIRQMVATAKGCVAEMDQWIGSAPPDCKCVIGERFSDRLGNGIGALFAFSRLFLASRLPRHPSKSTLWWTSHQTNSASVISRGFDTRIPSQRLNL